LQNYFFDIQEGSVAMKIEFHGDTDIGKVREINEDAFLLLPAVNAMAVCDGMGGHAAGEVASREALQTVSKYFNAGPDRFIDRLDFVTAADLPPGGRHLVRATRLANRRIFNIAQQSASHRGMGTTIVTMYFEDGIVSISHVGDSRAYRFRAGKLERLTVDHSLVAELVASREITEEESRTFAERNVITRALGTRPGVDVDIRIELTAAEDIYLACSDGLCGFIEDIQIERVLSEAGGDIQVAAENLIKAANEAGGEDNITVALARVEESGSAPCEARAAATVADADGATEAVTDEVLAELAALTPPQPDAEEDDTQKIQAAEAAPEEPDKKPSGSGGSRWLLWLSVLAVVTIFIFAGGMNLLVPPTSDDSTTTGVPTAENRQPAATASVFFDIEDQSLMNATVYVDDKMVGVAADFQKQGLDVDPGWRHIKCVIETTTVLDSLLDIPAGDHHFALSNTPQ